MITELQKRTAQAIVNIFETDKVRGDYNLVVLLPGDTGHLTYGRSQTTLGSGNLYKLIRDYCEQPIAQAGHVLQGYLPRLKARDLALDHDIRFKQWLSSAGDDPVMHAVQDAFFDRVYWKPALRRAEKAGITTALGIAVVYDSTIHGSWIKILNKVNRRAGTGLPHGECVWVNRYVIERRAWLASRKNKYLRRTVYRMDAFQKMIDAGNWDLDLPLKVRGKTISPETLGVKGEVVEEIRDEPIRVDGKP